MVLRYFFEAIPVGFTALSFDIDVVSIVPMIGSSAAFPAQPKGEEKCAKALALISSFSVWTCSA